MKITRTKHIKNCGAVASVKNGSWKMVWAGVENGKIVGNNKFEIPCNDICCKAKIIISDKFLPKY